MANSVVINYLVKVTGAKDVETLKARLTGLTTSQGFKSVVQGAGMGIGMGLWNQLAMSISQVPGALVDVTRAGAEEEAQILRLSQAISANDSSWNGNMAAVESVIDGRKRLAFSDDEMRESLLRLVPVTQNLNEALAVQKTAMDVARLRGISLEEASDKLGKVLVGNKRVLKELGIEVDATATRTEMLAEVQRRAAGQAEAYADTTIAGVTRMENAWEDLQEDLGKGVAQAADNAATGLGYLEWEMKKARETGIPLAQLFGLLPGLQDTLGTSTRDYAMYLAELTQQERAAATWSERLTAQAAAAAQGVGDLGDDADGSVDPLKDLADAERDAATQARRLEDNVTSALDALIEATLGPEQLRLKLAESKDETSELQAEIDKLNAKKTLTPSQRDELRDLKLRLSESKEETIRLAARMTQAGDLKLTDLVKEIDKLGLHTSDTTDEVWELVKALNSIPGVTGFTPPRHKNPNARAAGGPVSPGAAYLVGEKGPELFVPQRSGTIVPNTAMPGGVMTPVQNVIQLTVSGRVLAEVVDRELYYRLATAPQTTRAI